MITASNVNVYVGARLLLGEVGFRVSPGDKIGLVGRNGAGKTTLTKILAGEVPPSSGTVSRLGSVGHLPQDPRTGDLSVTAASRIMSARGVGAAAQELRRAESAMATATGAAQDRAMRAYVRAEEAFLAAGGYAAEAEAAQLAAGLGLPDRVLAQPLETLSGGQRRRVELARILAAGHDTLLLDEPTNHLDADSVGWLRGFLARYPGGLVLISHDVELLAATVNRVFHLDAHRRTIDIHNLGWHAYLTQREADERRRRRERANAERKAGSLLAQSARMSVSVGTASAAKNMARRADRLLSGLEEVRRSDKVARIRLPEPAHCGRIPLSASGLSKSYGSLEVLTGVDLTVDRGSRIVVLGLNGAGKTTLLRMLAGKEQPDGGRVAPGHGLRLGYFAQEHETLDPARTVGQNLAGAAPELTDVEARRLLGSFLFGGEDAAKPAAVLSGGEKTRLALAMLVSSRANVLLLDEPTNNLDPASRQEVLGAIQAYQGAIVLVTHDEGAVQALQPDRVLVLPDGVEDLWSPDYGGLVELA